MNLYLLDEDFKFICPIDFAEEVLWIRKYNGLGECQLKIQCDYDIVELLKDKDEDEAVYIIDLDDSDQNYICELAIRNLSTTVNQGDYITITSYDAINLLSRRIVLEQPVFGTEENPVTEINPVDFMLAILKECNPAGSHRTDNTWIIDETSFQKLRSLNDIMEITDVTRQDVLTVVLNICVQYNYGIQMLFDKTINKFVLSVYKGQEVDVEFSPNYANIGSTEYMYDKSTKRNWGIVVGVSGKKTHSDEVETTPLVEVFFGSARPMGRNLREVTLDGSVISREVSYSELKRMYKPFKYEEGSIYTDGYHKIGDVVVYWGLVGNEYKAIAEMDSDFLKGKLYEEFYLPRLKQQGLIMLKQLNETKSFSGEVEIVNNYQYQSDYNVGDIVTAFNNYNVGGKARITEIWITGEGTSLGDVIEAKFEWQEEVL